MFCFILFTIFLTSNCYRVDENIFNNTFVNVNMKPNAANLNGLPSYWDWREKNKVSPVKDQGTCNACWAFSTVANIESILSIHKNQNIQLSEQFLMDCDGRGIGCKSSSILNTFSVIVDKLGGVVSASDYNRSYDGKVMQCTWNGYPKPVPVIGYRRVQSDEEVMAKFLYSYGPLSAGINSASMRKYTGGIDEPTDDICPPNNLDHAILIVGYNVYVDPKTGKDTPYWIIKNSWGTGWGDKGFYYLLRGRNACGISLDVSFSFVG